MSNPERALSLATLWWIGPVISYIVTPNSLFEERMCAKELQRRFPHADSHEGAGDRVADHADLARIEDRDPATRDDVADHGVVTRCVAPETGAAHRDAVPAQGHPRDP